MRKLSRKRAESVAGFGILLLFLFAGVTAWLAVSSGWRNAVVVEGLPPIPVWSASVPTLVAAAFLTICLPVWVLSWLLLRLRRVADEERDAWERMEAERRTKRTDHALFSVDDQGAFTGANRLLFVEKYIVPISSLIMSIVLAGAAVLFFRMRYQGAGWPNIEKTGLATAFLVCEAFFCFLIGMYAKGMGRHAEWRPLRAGASFAVGGALMLVAGAASLGAFSLNVPQVESIAGYIVPVFMGLVALEIFINFVLDFYRPRVAGQEARPSYESRILGLFVEPGGVLRTVATTLDYQFGFKVSETWFYRFLERSVAPLVLFWVLTFYLLTSILIIGPSELAIVEHFGVPRDGGQAIGPGLHLKWPWPIERVHRFPATETREMILGGEGLHDERGLIWTAAHFEKEYPFLVAKRLEEADKGAGKDAAPALPVSLMAANMSLQYRVKQSERGLYNYQYKVRNPDQLIEALAYREMTQYMASVDLHEVMTTERRKATKILKQRIQATLDREELGVEVVFVGFLGVHPPVENEVGLAFERVGAAEEKVLAAVLEAEGYKNRQEAMAKADEARVLDAAIAGSFGRMMAAEGEHDRFKSQVIAHEAAPDVYRVREKLLTAERGLKDIRKYLIITDEVDRLVIPIDLEEVKRPELWDVDLTRPDEGKEEE